MASLMLGCSDEPEARTFTEDDDVGNTAPIESHDHASAPHGGLYAVFGAEEYHGEVVYNEEADELTVYILGSDGQTPHPIAEPEVMLKAVVVGGDPIELTLASAPDAGDPEGKSSRFQVTGAPEALHMADTVTIVATIDGEEFEGEVIREAHAHDHSHDHADEEHEHSHDDHAAEESHEHSHSDAGDAEAEHAGDEAHTVEHAESDSAAETANP